MSTLSQLLKPWQVRPRRKFNQPFLAPCAHSLNTEGTVSSKMECKAFKELHIMIGTTSDLPPPTKTKMPSTWSHRKGTQSPGVTLKTPSTTHPYQWFPHIFLLRVELASLLDFVARLSPSSWAYYSKNWIQWCCLILDLRMSWIHSNLRTQNQWLRRNLCIKCTK